MKYSERISTAAILYVVILAAHVALIWALPWLPTQDGPAHIYNLVILHDLLNGGKEWGNFFTYKLSPVPNLGFNLISYPLLGFFTPLVVEKIFVSVYILLIGVCIPVLLKTFERAVFPLSFLVFPVIFNFTLLMGFYSYAIAVPLFVFALSMALRIHSKSAVCRFVCLNLAGLVLFYVHLIPFVFFLIFLCALAVAEQPDAKAKMAGLLRLSFMVAPCLLQFVLYLLHGKHEGIVDFSYLFSKGRNVQLMADLAYLSTVNYSQLQILPAVILSITSLYFLLLFLLEKLLGQQQPLQTGEKALLYLLSVLTMIYFLAPIHFGGGSFFNQRFPWVIFIVAIPLLQIPESPLLRIFSMTVVAVAIVVNFAVNAFLMQEQSAMVDKYVSGLSAGVPKGAFVMTYKTKDDWSRIDVLMHAASYYGIFAGCVDIDNYETSSDYFPVHFKHTLTAFPSPAQIDYKPKSIDWTEYPAIQFLIGWEIDGREARELAGFYRLIRLDGSLSIWQRDENSRRTDIAIPGTHGKL